MDKDNNDMPVSPTLDYAASPYMVEQIQSANYAAGYDVGYNIGYKHGYFTGIIVTGVLTIMADALIRRKW